MCVWRGVGDKHLHKKGKKRKPKLNCYKWALFKFFQLGSDAEDCFRPLETMQQSQSTVIRSVLRIGGAFLRPKAIGDQCSQTCAWCIDCFATENQSCKRLCSVYSKMWGFCPQSFCSKDVGSEMFSKYKCYKSSIWYRCWKAFFDIFSFCSLIWLLVGSDVFL